MCKELSDGERPCHELQGRKICCEYRLYIMYIESQCTETDMF